MKYHHTLRVLVGRKKPQSFILAGLLLSAVLFSPSLLWAEEPAPWWQYSYEGETPLGADSGAILTLATDKKFAPGPDAVSLSEDGIWHQNTGAEESYALAWKPSDTSTWGYTTENSVTVEARLKVNKAGVGGEEVPVGYIRMAPIEEWVSGRTFYFYYGHNWIGLGGSNYGSIRRYPLNTEEFHTYRIVIEANPRQVVADLYVDDDPAPVCTTSAGSGEPGGSARLVFGDTQYGETGLIGGDISLDYLRWSEGAIRPEE